jgi:hypothetical protein
MIINNKNIDYLAELVVSHLMTSRGIDDSGIFIHLIGVFHRFFSFDIEKVRRHRNEAGEEEWHLFLNREGLYDLLPEGFFHGHSGKLYKDRAETKAEFRMHRKEERNARQFFMPLEQEFFNCRLQKEIFEQNYFYAPETIQEFIDFFDFGHLPLSLYQKAVLFFLLPHLSLIAGNLPLTETCFEIILQEKVNFSTIQCPPAGIEENHIPSLNASCLGVNSLLGNICVDHNPQLQIKIGPLRDSDTLLQFLKGDQLELIDRLAELFIQADLTTRVEITLNADDEKFILGEQAYEARLNYSTTL